MVEIPNYWFEKNSEMLKLIFSNNLIGKGKMCKLTDFLLLIDKKNIDKSAEERQIIKDNVSSFLPEMESYSIIILKKYQESTTYIYPGSEFVSVKTSTLTTKSPPEIVDPLPTDEISSEIIGTVSNFEYFCRRMENYSGNDKKFVTVLLKLIPLAIDIINDETTHWKYRTMLNGALGHIFIGGDDGKDDYMAYLFVISFALKHIGNQSPALLMDHWKENERLRFVLDNAYQNTKFVMSNNERRDILYKTGITGLIRKDESLTRNELLGCVAYLMGKVYEIVPEHKSEEYLINKLLKIGIYDDVRRCIAIAKGEVVQKSRESYKDDILDDDEYQLLLEGL